MQSWPKRSLKGAAITQMPRKVKFPLSLPVKLCLSALGISEQWFKIQCQGMHGVIIYNDAVQMANACSACVHGMTSCNLVPEPSQRGTQKPRSLLSAEKSYFIGFPLASSHKRADFFLLSSTSLLFHKFGFITLERQIFSYLFHTPLSC